MKAFFLISILSWSTLSFAAKPWPNPESKDCHGPVECRSKGDFAIERGFVDFDARTSLKEEAFEIRAPSVVVMGHSSSAWDTSRATESSVRQLMTELRKRNLPIVYLSPQYKIDASKEFLN